MFWRARLGGASVLCIGYGQGADALLLRVVQPGPTISPSSMAIEYASYPLYRKLREYLRESSGGPEISNVLWQREERQNVRFHGMRCELCGTVQFPIARVCIACKTSEVARRPGTYAAVLKQSRSDSGLD